MPDLTHAAASEVYDFLVVTEERFLRLYTADPGKDQDFTDEVVGGSYTGQSLAGVMGAPTDGDGTNTALVTFLDMPAVTVTHYAICRSAAGTSDPSEQQIVGPLVVPKTTSAGETLQIALGDLDLTAS